MEQLYDEDARREKILCPSHRRRGLASRRRFQLGRPISRIRTANRRSRGNRGRDIEAIEAEVARKYKIVPLFVRRRSSFLAADPFNSSIHRRPDFCFGFGDSFDRLRSGYVEDLLDTYYAKEESTMGDLSGASRLAGFRRLDETKERSDGCGQRNPIIRFVNLVIQQAIRAQASDIHFEPFEEEFKIRYRVDGALYEMSPPPKSLALPLFPGSR